MDISVLTELLNNTAFPIVCVLIMFYMQYQDRKDHKEETNKFTEAINNNTLAIEKLLERLDKDV